MKYTHEEMSKIITLLKEAKCPNCDGSGIIYKTTMKTGMISVENGNLIPTPKRSCFDIEPCQWCHERDLILINE